MPTLTPTPQPGEHTAPGQPRDWAVPRVTEFVSTEGPSSPEEYTVLTGLEGITAGHLSNLLLKQRHLRAYGTELCPLEHLQ